jgi:ABC-2 type transport system ATP-binding protein
MVADDRDGPDGDNPAGPDEPESAEPESAELTNAAEPVIEVLGLAYERADRRRFLRLRRARVPIRALSDITFTIARGEAVGCLGPRGSGKTTLLKLVTGILTPAGGTVHTGAEPNERNQRVSRIGAVFADHPQLWPDLSLGESLRVLAAKRGLPQRQWLPRRNELVERLELTAFLEMPVHQLSPGRRRCAEVAASLLHEPELVVLDQPTLDLDVRSKGRLRSLLRHENRFHRRTILVTSSELGDVEQFCDRLLVIDHGRLTYDGDVAGLISRAWGQRILVVDLSEPDRLLDDVPGTSLFAVEAGGLRQRLSFAPGEVSTAAVLAEVTARAGIRDLTLEDPRLEDVVHRLRFNPAQANGS